MGWTETVRIVAGLSVFIALLSFKPSEPYLSQYLICPYETANVDCNSNTQQDTCATADGCAWLSGSCSAAPCSSLTTSECGNSDYFYCETTHDQCAQLKCYENFTEDEVNNDIYPWSTYAYLPFLLVLGPAAELFSYRLTILAGILGRVVTRILLIFGNTILQMQLMQVAYSLGTAAEDVFSAYVYYIVPADAYQLATSWVRASALLSCTLSGILGDVLVVVYDTSLTTLMWVSAVFVWLGFISGLWILRSRRHSSDGIVSDPNNRREHHGNSSSNSNQESWRQRWEKTTLMFSQQLRCLRFALRSPALCMLLGLWTIGNAVYMTVYDYEVSLYLEWNNGLNTWNGSVLALLLVAGSLGALLPWLEETYAARHREEDDGESLLRDREISVPPLPSARLVAGGSVALIGLVICALCWQLVPSIAGLAVFFAGWQYVHVITFTQVATHLKAAENRLQESAANRTCVVMVTPTGDDGRAGSSSTTRMSDLALSTVDNRYADKVESDSSQQGERWEAPYSLAIVLIVAVNVLNQIILQAVLFSAMQAPLRTALWCMMIVFAAAICLFLLGTIWSIET